MGSNNEVQIPRVYIAHGTADNVLPIASTSRIFANSLRKNGYQVEFHEFSGSHHLSRQVVDQAMTWLTATFQQHR
jgi:predicted esterase